VCGVGSVTNGKICTRCDIGMSSPASTAPCADCTAGRYASGEGSAQCTECAWDVPAGRRPR
jgi:hypothetical protein